MRSFFVYKYIKYMAKKKTYKRSKISDDERWTEYDKLKSSGKIFEAQKLKDQILDSYVFKKECHHVAGEVV